MPERLWTITDVAYHLGVRERVIQRHVDAGTIPYRRLGKAIRFRPQDIDRWVAALPGGKLPATLPVGPPVPRGISEAPQDTSAPVVALVKGAKGRNRERLVQGDGR